MSRKASSFVLSADRRARDALKSKSVTGVGTQSCKLHPSQCRMRDQFAFVLPHYVSLVSPSLARRQANAVEFATEVCFSLFDGSEVLARLMSCTKGKLCNMWRLRNLWLVHHTDIPQCPANTPPSKVRPPPLYCQSSCIGQFDSL